MRTLLAVFGALVTFGLSTVCLGGAFHLVSEGDGEVTDAVKAALLFAAGFAIAGCISLAAAFESAESKEEPPHHDKSKEED